MHLTDVLCFLTFLGSLEYEKYEKDVPRVKAMLLVPYFAI